MENKGPFYIGSMPEEMVQIAYEEDPFACGFSCDEGWCVFVDRLMKEYGKNENSAEQRARRKWSKLKNKISMRFSPDLEEEPIRFIIRKIEEVCPASKIKKVAKDIAKFEINGRIINGKKIKYRPEDRIRKIK